MAALREWGVPPLGYSRHPITGALDSTPWPDQAEDIPPSIGWGVIDWCERNLVHHLDGSPWRFTPDQKRFLVLWYAVDHHGRWKYRRGTLRRSKGAGKDPFAAALALAELLGPTKFAAFADNGDPIGQSHRKSLVLVAANSQDQAKELLQVANAMMSDDLKAREGYTPGEVKSAARGGRRIKILTSSEASSEGDPATAVILNETHHFTESNGGKKVAAVARRNVGKSPGGQARVIQCTNAHEEGGGSVAEDTYLAWQAQAGGKTRNKDILYSSVEADPSLSFVNPEDVMTIVQQAYMYAPWILEYPERIVAEIHDPETTLAESIRFYANGLAAAESAWVDPANVRAAHEPREVKPGERIALALDCSKSEDSTTLVGVCIDDGYTFALGIWQRPRGDRGRGWLAPRDEVDVAVRLAFVTYQVTWFGVDPSPATDDDTERSYWQPLLDQWHREYHQDLAVWASPQHSVQFDMRLSINGGRERLRLFTEQCMLTGASIDEAKTFRFDGDPALAHHIISARRRPNDYGVGIGKASRDSKDKIDYAVTMVMAQLGRRQTLNARQKPPARKAGAAWAW